MSIITVRPGETITVIGMAADPNAPRPSHPIALPGDPWWGGGGPVDPGYFPPGVGPGNPGGPGGGGPPYPSHPIYNPGGPPGSSPPGFWGGGMGPGVKPQPPWPEKPPPVEPPPAEEGGNWVWAWSPQQGRWVWVQVPGEGEAGPKEAA